MYCSFVVNNESAACYASFQDDPLFGLADLLEPILMDNPDRFTMFPIKYPQVSQFQI